MSTPARLRAVTAIFGDITLGELAELVRLGRVVF